jgi:NAD(P)-dependent dehydrogenase (short-subunit alcohol dehydrogenase family)
MTAKLILITGTSSGFGKTAVTLLLEKGHTVIAGIRGGDSRLKEIFPAEIAKHGSRLRALDLHMDKEESLATVRDLIDREYGGKLDVLINNAGLGFYGALEDQAPEQLRDQMEVNFFGPVFLTRLLIPALRKARGRVISTSSIAGLITFPYYGAYCVSKFALESMMEGLHYQLKPFGVQVALVEPGGFRTEFTKSKTFPQASYLPGSLYRARTEAMEKFLKGVDFRLADPLKVSKLLVKLCEKRRIRLRYLIGLDAHFARLTWRILPDGLRVFLQDWVFSKVVFRE